MESKLFSYLYYIFLIILWLSFFSNISALYFAYPTALSLKNKQILIVHEEGITICDENFTTIIKNVTTFSPNKLNSEDHLYKVSIEQFSNSYGVCIVFNRLFIINSLGNIILNDLLISNNNLYLTLSIEKFYSTDYYYLIGYIYQNSLFLRYYKFNSETKTNQNIKFDNFKPDNNDILNQGLTCQFIKNPIQIYLVCFYYVYYNNSHCLVISSFSVGSNAIILNSARYIKVLAPITFLKSTVSSDNQKALIAFYQSNGKQQTFLFYFNENVNIREIEICKYNKFATIGINYIIEKNEFIFTCVTNEGNSIYAVFYNKGTDSITNYLIRNLKCNNFNHHSLLFLRTKSEYDILIDLKCENKIDYS